ncbi:MAG TPA: homoserine dehydrogenase [Syntrophales bacterium]|nr:homoserine dehydrogenase [Syntrophales bacterium]HOL58533.1 homoserine dehydrogenase [Syntrophales bacterium]HPO34859.1 homoserine dehydrogenase [Syntrophales bacterium]
MNIISIGLIGFGTIGSGVVKLLTEAGRDLKRRLGFELRLKKIADVDLKRVRPVSVPAAMLTPDPMEIVNDPEIDIVIELIGGCEPAGEIIKAALRRKKHVVTANKALLAECGDELWHLARQEHCDIGFEASVGGTIPIIKTIRESLVANEIEHLMAIMNGTTNYVLTKMTDESREFGEVLAEAQRLGFAEADPSFDIDGKDTAHKLAIVLSLAYGGTVRLSDFYCEGIRGISHQDIEFARELGYRVKLLAIAFKRGEKVEARIHPTMIPMDHLLASVGSNYNAFYIVGSASGPIFLFGQGAGMMPTASAVVGDVVDIAKRMMRGGKKGLSPGAGELMLQPLDLIPFDEICTNYYFRFMAADRAGVLSKISGILGNHNISIASVIQKGRKKDGAVPIVMVTHEARERDVKEALKKIERLEVVHERVKVIRIEDERLK